MQCALHCKVNSSNRRALAGRRNVTPYDNVTFDLVKQPPQPLNLCRLSSSNSFCQHCNQAFQPVQKVLVYATWT